MIFRKTSAQAKRGSRFAEKHTTGASLSKKNRISIVFFPIFTKTEENCIIRETAGFIMNTEKYFDWASTAPADEDILRKALEKSIEFAANPSSAHQEGLEARKEIESCRERCAKVLGVKKETVVFTSGGTESDQIPILTLLRRPSAGSIIISNIEHPAVAKQAEMLKHCGWKILKAECNQRGIVTPEAVVSKIESDTAMVCIMAVNNETGAIQPIYEISDAITKHCAGKRRPKLHIDAVQAAGKIPLELSYKGIDFAAISGHKICGPRGIGLLYAANKPECFLTGGGQESGIRSGTENLFGIEALTECLERYYMRSGNAAKDSENLKKLAVLEEKKMITGKFINHLKELPFCTILPESRTADDGDFSFSVVQASFENLPGQVLVRELSDRGFCISTGSACSTNKNERPILNAMGVKGDLAKNAVRFSFSAHSTEDGMEELFKAVKESVEKFNR